MRQKKHDYTLMSDKKCSHSGCKTLIKQNVIDRKQEDSPILCMKHYKAKKNKGSKPV